MLSNVGGMIFVERLQKVGIQGGEYKRLNIFQININLVYVHHIYALYRRLKTMEVGPLICIRLTVAKDQCAHGMGRRILREGSRVFPMTPQENKVDT